MADTLYFELRLDGKSYIRLLQIDQNYSSSSEIHCSLEVADLQAGPIYQALSYTWGSAYHLPQGKVVAEVQSESSALPFIICNNRKVEVTRNLFDALVEFRRREDVQHLWVDALCINQTDNSERSKQVLLMGDIYAQAREVLVWLGKPNENFEHFRWATMVFFPKLETLFKKYSINRVLSTQIVEAFWVDELGITDLASRLFAYGAFHDANRWFTRSWIIQEVANAREIRIICGISEISWRNVENFSLVCTMTEWVFQARVQIQGRHPAPTVETSSMDVYRWQVLRDSCSKGSVSERVDAQTDLLNRMCGSTSKIGHGFAWLLYVLLAIRVSNCSDPHDKVYAALGIGQRLLVGDIGDYIIPNYDLPAAHAYKEVTKLIIENTRSINALSFCALRSSNTTASLPTWVPDYGNSAAIESSLPVFRGWPHFNASLSCGSEDFRCRIKDDTLILEGKQLDFVAEICPSTTRQWTATHSFHAVLEFCYQDITNRGDLTRIEELWRTMMGDTLDDQHPAPSSVAQNFRNFVQTFAAIHMVKSWQDEPQLEARRISIAAVLTKYNSPKELPTMDEIDQYFANLMSAAGLARGSQDRTGVVRQLADNDRETTPFLDQGQMLGTSRRLFITGRGHLGLAVEKVESGDQIWSILNCRVPLLLRSCGIRTYELVSECYAHGFMHGETLQGGLKSGSQFIPITLI